MKNKKYIDWLIDIIGDGEDGEYTMLLEHLHQLIFYPLVPNDDNRADDGEQLREQYLDEAGPTGPSSLPNNDCTVLELLIGIAYRLEFDLLGGEYEEPVDHWFWVLIDNLGLSECDNDAYLYSDGEEEVNVIIHNLLDRRYGTDGLGGLFPLENAEKDQRRIEIWYQMSAWIIENYPI